MNPILRPFAWILRMLYLLTGNMGWALILFALVIKLILLPLSMKSKKSMMKTSRLAPRMKALERQYSNDKMKYQAEVSKLYKEEGVNPMTGCLWSLIPFPILIGLYYVIRQPMTYIQRLTSDEISLVTGTLEGLGVDLSSMSARSAYYSEVYTASHAHHFVDQIKAVIPDYLDLNFDFLGLDLGAIPQWNFWKDGVEAFTWAAVGLFLIPILSGLFNYLSSWMSQKLNSSVTTDDKGNPDNDAIAATQSSMKTMFILMPLISVYIGFVMPAAIEIYWIAQAVFNMLQEFILTRHYRKVYDAEDAIKAQRAAEQAELEAERMKKWEENRAKNPGQNPNTSKRKIKNQAKALELPEVEGKLTDEERAELRQQREAELEKRKRAMQGQIDAARPYSRGRAYDPTRFARDADTGSSVESTASSEVSDADLPQIDSAPHEDVPNTNTTQSANPADCPEADASAKGE